MLKGAALRSGRGKLAAIVGESGSGKSSLLNLLTGIDLPSHGRVLVDGKAIRELNEDQRAAWRGQNLGIVFQFFQLVPTLTVQEYVLLPTSLSA